MTSNSALSLRGDGCETNIDLAKKWLKLAVDNDNTDDSNTLLEIVFKE